MHTKIVKSILVFTTTFAYMINTSFLFRKLGIVPEMPTLNAALQE